MSRTINILYQLVVTSCIIRHQILPVGSFSMSSLSSSSSKRATALVTGSTDGIGITTTKYLASKGYNVFVHGRNDERIERAVQKVESFVQDWGNEGDNNGEKIQIIPIKADLSSLEGCYALIRSIEMECQNRQLDLQILMNNAGVFEEQRVQTVDGLELTFAVNVLAPFVLTSHFLPLLLQQQQQQRQARIVVASSISQSSSIRHWDDIHFKQRRYSAHAAYAESKLFDAMLTVEMATRLRDDAQLKLDRITCNCLDPGTVNTKMLLAGWGPCGIDVEDALDQTWLCTSDEVKDVTGKYFVWQSPRRASSDAYDVNKRNMLWATLSTLAPDAASMWDFRWL